MTSKQIAVQPAKLCVLLLFFLLTGQVLAQTTISGKVTDKQGEPMIGATVTVKNAPTLGTVTDIDGLYTLKASKGERKLNCVSVVAFTLKFSGISSFYLNG